MGGGGGGGGGWGVEFKEAGIGCEKGEWICVVVGWGEGNG